MASTNTEIYRRFTGELRPGGLRFLPLARASIRTACKRKLPLLVLYAPPTIATVIFSFVVYLRFAMFGGETPAALGGGSLDPRTIVMAGIAETLMQVRTQIVGFHVAMTMFAFLILSWFGSGEIAEDRRVGAHLLYFARPLTRLDYLLAKFTTLAFFGSLAVIVPGLVICTVATFSSPEWSFLKQEGSVIWKTVVFGLLWVTVCSSVVLAVSSLASRKSFALVAAFAVFLLPLPVGAMLADLENEPRFLLLSLPGNFAKVVTSMFGMRNMGMGFDATLAYAALAGITLVAWIVLAVRVRRMEAVA